MWWKCVSRRERSRQRGIWIRMALKYFCCLHFVNCKLCFKNPKFYGHSGTMGYSIQLQNITTLGNVWYALWWANVRSNQQQMDQSYWHSEIFDQQSDSVRCCTSEPCAARAKILEKQHCSLIFLSLLFSCSFGDLKMKRMLLGTFIFIQMSSFFAFFLSFLDSTPKDNH